MLSPYNRENVVMTGSAATTKLASEGGTKSRREREREREREEGGRWEGS
jgi:hypothetical protein